MPFKSHVDKNLNYKDYYDKERFDREEKRFVRHFGQRSFLLPFNITHTILNIFITNWLTSVYYSLYSNFLAMNSKYHLIGLLNENDRDKWFSSFAWTNIFNFGSIFSHYIVWFVLFIIFTVLQINITLRLYHRFTRRAVDQLGEARFANLEELQRLLPLAPDHEYMFEGYGGAPLFHLPPNAITKKLRNKYDIPEGMGAYGYTPPKYHSHKLIIGNSGSAKGQTYVLPDIDLISRAKEKSSMIINDPKAENLTEFYDTLRSRGYDVKFLDLIEPMNGISYNPLQLAINYAKNKQYDNVQKEINSLSFTLYNDESASDKHWQTSAQSLFNALALSLLDYCEFHKDYSKATIINVAKMLSSLGAVDDPNSNPFRPKKELNTYFERLIDKNNNPNARFSKLAELAIQEFSISNFAASGEAGSIKSTAMVGLEIYNQDKIARMTSRNSFNLARLGFPRHLDFNIGKEFAFKNVDLEFIDNNNNLIEKFRVPIDETGRFSYEIENKLSDISTLNINVSDTNYSVSYELKKKKKINDNGNVVIDKYTNMPIYEPYLQCEETKNNIGHSTDISVEYKEKPTAMFIVTPAYDSSYNQITSFFISQAYKANVEPATAHARGRKMYVPLNIILDEFGNLPEIKDMGQKITVARSYGITFELAIQNFKQLNNVYGDNLSAIIKDNCATWVYIKTNDLSTAKEVAEKMGKKTIEVHGMNGNDYHMTDGGNTQENIQSYELITVEELMNLKEGETIVIAGLNRKDVYGNKIVPKPIFNRFDRSMPFAYKLLANTMNDNRTLESINQNPSHRYLDITDNTVTASQFKAFSLALETIPKNEDQLLTNINNGENSIEEKSNFDEDIKLFDTDKLRHSKEYKDKCIKTLSNILPETNLQDRLTIINSIDNDTLDKLDINDFVDSYVQEALNDELQLA